MAAPNDGPQSKYWFLTVTHASSRPDPTWPEVIKPNGGTFRPRPAHLMPAEEAAIRAWRIPPRALNKIEAVRLTAEQGAGADDPQHGLLHLHLCIKLKTKCRSQPLRLLLGLDPWQYHSEVIEKNGPLLWKALMEELPFSPCLSLL